MSKQMIKELCEIKALSGHEKPVKEYLNTKLSVNADKVLEDNLGSVIYKYSGAQPGLNIAVIAHMDEVGMLVKHITDKGLIKIANVGGLVPESVLCQHVELINRNQDVFSGAVLGVSPHNNQGDKIKLDNLLLDFGFNTSEEVLAAGIRLGDQIIMRSEFRELANEKLMAKAFDNRLGCAAIIELAEHYQTKKFMGNLYFAASVQEEVGLRGASTIMHAMDEEIDYVLVIDVSPVDDTVKVENCKLGGGTLIRVKDPRMVLDYAGVGRLQRLSKEFNIDAQEFFSSGGTDAAQIQVQNKGYITNALCVPGRNLHTNNSIVDYKDYQATVELSKRYIDDILGGKK